MADTGGRRDLGKNWAGVFIALIGVAGSLGGAYLTTTHTIDSKNEQVTETGKKADDVKRTTDASSDRITALEKKLSETAGSLDTLKGELGAAQSKLAQAQLSAATLAAPVGTIMPYAGHLSEEVKRKLFEAGWEPCEGQEHSETEFEPLFRAINYAWGKGNNPGYFRLPDLRGQFLRGVDGEKGVDPDAKTRTASAAGGNTGDKVGSAEADAFQGHAHAVRERAFDAGSAKSGNGGDRWTIDPHDSGKDIIASLAVKYGNYGDPRVAMETRPKNVAVHWLIRVKP